MRNRSDAQRQPLGEQLDAADRHARFALRAPRRDLAAAARLPFEHRSVSVFRGFDEFRRINPVVKAPTLVCDDGTVLMDSGLIIEYAESIAARRSLMPRGARRAPARAAPHRPGARGVRERRADRLRRQCSAAGEAPRAVARADSRAARRSVVAAGGGSRAAAAARPDGWIDQAGLTVAVVWHFLQRRCPASSTASPTRRCAISRHGPSGCRPSSPQRMDPASTAAKPPRAPDRHPPARTGSRTWPRSNRSSRCSRRSSPA